MTPLAAFAAFVDRWNDRLGRSLAWLALAMVLTQFVVVVFRYVFGLGWIFVQESITYMHAILFMMGAGYTLLHEGHVRVDIFYRDMGPLAKARVDLFGALLLLTPFCAIIFVASYPYVLSSWQVFEGSKETSGIHGVFLLKTAILGFSVLMVLQGLALAARSALTLAGIAPPEPPAMQRQKV